MKTPFTRLDNSPAAYDQLPPEYRELVQEFGLFLVRTCVQVGVTKPGAIRHLIHAVWLGAREPGNRRPGIPGSEGRGAFGLADHLESFLFSHGCCASAKALLSFLRTLGFVVVPRSPTREMVKASCEAVTYALGVMSKTEKHRRRLLAALEAEEKKHFPDSPERE